MPRNQSKKTELSSFSVAISRFGTLPPNSFTGISQPAISWKTTASEKNWMQSGYELARLDEDDEPISTSGKVNSNESIHIPWPFAPLQSRERARIAVRVWDQHDKASPWSKPVWVEAGLLDATDWTAVFVRPAWNEDTSVPQPGPLLRHEFTVSGQVVHARLYASALGVYEARLNGKPVSDQVMAPGWTSYHHRLRYQIYDVTHLVHNGLNAIGMWLGDGWYRGRLNFGGGEGNLYGTRIAGLAQLEITFADGSRKTIKTGGNWKAIRGPILENDIYNGEKYDARREITGWDLPGLDDSAWEGVRKVRWDLGNLFAPLEPPVRPVRELQPVRIFTSPSGKTLADFGQNLVGRVRIRVKAPSGNQITLRHAEVLEHGELGTRPLRYAKATDQYITSGRKTEEWAPRFTFHGFRYVEVDGWPGKLRKNQITAEVCHSDMPRTGWFECSHPLINQLHENVVWSMRGNFYYIPTDCPQRDERLGWTGDIQVFSPTASYLFDSYGFLDSWLQDVAAEQRELNNMPFVVPNTLGKQTPPAAAWGDAATVVPWVLYQRFGDPAILAQQFDSMCAWVDQIHAICGEKLLWERGFQFGDWLDPAAPPDNPAKATTPAFIVATAYFARSADLTARAAAVLGYTKQAEKYQSLAKAIRSAFADAYITPAGRVIGDASTAYALALQFDLLPSATARRGAAARLSEIVRDSGYHISTGFAGTPLICDALSENGYLADAYRLLTQTTNPSWLYPVTMGATSIWERWDSMLPNGEINPGEMTSFNHYALGAVADWLQRSIGGISPAAPGYKRITIQPRLGGGLSRGSTALDSVYGMIRSSWSVDGDTFHLKVEIPPNTSAEVILPGKEGAAEKIGSGEYDWTIPLPERKSAAGKLTLQSTVAELLDDSRARMHILPLLEAANPQVGMHLMLLGTSPIEELLAKHPRTRRLAKKIAAILAGLSD